MCITIMIVVRIGLHSGDIKEEMVADHLDSNSAFYSKYLSLSVPPMMPIMLI